MHPVDTPPDAQGRTGKEISRRAVMLSTPQNRKNASLLISRLSDDVLEDIFVRCARDGYYAPHTQRDAAPRLQVPRWTAISHVCLHWRKVALNCPALWCHLFLASPQWSEVLFARSSHSPLRVCIVSPDGENEVMRDFLVRLAAHAGRLVECYIWFRGSYRWPEAARLLMTLSRSAPRLRTLKIKTEYPDSNEMPEVVDGRMLFDGDTPMLRELELVHFGMPWCSPTLRGLTTLHLTHLAAPYQLTIPELVEVLGRMPELQYLHLENALQSDLPVLALKSAEKLRLTSLVRLLVCSPLSQTVSLLSHIEIPFTRQVVLKCFQSTELGADECTLMWSLLSRWLCALTPEVSPIRTISIENGSSARFQFTGSRVEREWGAFCDDADDTLLMVEVCPWHWDEGDALLSHVLPRLPLAYLESLCLVDCCFSAKILLDTFGHLQALRCIKVSDDGLLELIRALSMPCGPDRGHIFAPALKQLVVARIGWLEFRDFEDEGDEDEEVAASDVYADLYTDKTELLVRALVRRRLTYNTTLDQLRVVDCTYFCEESASQLGREVGEIDWDGIESEDGAIS